MDNQWFDGFSTDTPLKCPECELLFLDNEWSFITDYLCTKGFLYRQVVYKTYLCPQQFVELKGSIDIGRQYVLNEINAIRSHVYGRYSLMPITQSEITDIVYFDTTFLYPRTVYTFEYGDYLIRDHFQHVHKELVEYVFHPSRIKNIEDLDDM